MRKAPDLHPQPPPPRLPPPISAAPLTIFKVIKQAFSVSYKMDLQQQNNGFGPISKPRGRASVITASLMIVLASAVHFTIAYSSENKEGRVGFHFLLFSFALLILSFVLGELVRRLCLVSEEIRHKETRYKGSWKKVFTSTFTFRHGRTALVVVIASLLFVFYFLYEHCNTCCRSEYAILFSLNCFLSPLLLFLIGLREISSVGLSEINENNNKNVADGLAWGYYFGYLKMVLPILAERIGQTDYKYLIPIHKLFILIPKTCYIYDSIEKADHRMKFFDNLTLTVSSRGGVSKLKYKTSVHRIEILRPDGTIDPEPPHVAVEYAVPLRSLYAMSDPREGVVSCQERDEQVILNLRSTC